MEEVGSKGNTIPALAAAQTEWVFDPVEPVLGPGEPGGWDAGFRYPLAVVEVDGTYHLFFNGQQEGVSGHFDTDIGHATSADGVSWELDPANPVLDGELKIHSEPGKGTEVRVSLPVEA